MVILGCGYVGTRLAAQALARGLTVEAVTRNTSQAALLRDMGVAKVAVCNLAGEDWHEQIASGADIAVNCVSGGGGGIDGYRQSYVDGMISMLTWARREPAGLLLYTGSTSVYPQDGGATVSETSSTGGDAYAEILLEAEGLLRHADVRECQRWIILRLAGIYGPGRHYLLDQLRRGETSFPGSASHRLNLVHVDDVCAAVWAVAASQVRNEILNVADDAPAPKSEVTNWLAQRLGLPPPVFSGEGGLRRDGAKKPDRIVLNLKLKALTGWVPGHPDYKSGYAPIFEA